MNYELNKISLKSAAEQLNVSVVSIHNWIKDGTLKTIDGILTQECLDDFKRDFLNKNKLSSRANKQYKDIHNHKQLTEDIRLKINSELSGGEISDSYEASLSESYKNKEGIYYTPQYIVEDMMRDITDVEGKTFLDPCRADGPETDNPQNLQSSRTCQTHSTRNDRTDWATESASRKVTSASSTT